MELYNHASPGIFVNIFFLSFSYDYSIVRFQSRPSRKQVRTSLFGANLTLVFFFFVVVWVGAVLQPNCYNRFWQPFCVN